MVVWTTAATVSTAATTPGVRIGSRRLLLVSARQSNSSIVVHTTLKASMSDQNPARPTEFITRSGADFARSAASATSANSASLRLTIAWSSPNPLANVAMQNSKATQRSALINGIGRCSQCEESTLTATAREPSQGSQFRGPGSFSRRLPSRSCRSTECSRRPKPPRPRRGRRWRSSSRLLRRRQTHRSARYSRTRSRRCPRRHLPPSG